MVCTLNVRNVREALPKGVGYLLSESQWENSRNGRVLVAPGPVATVYEKPQERVLLSPIRDANPFFHLFESLWLLQGRNDAKWLDRFVSDFSSRFAEEDGIQHGAYGYRWRDHFEMEGGGHDLLPDQLNTIVNILRKDPSSRQAVLTMWDPVADLGQKKKDLPCNTHVYFRIRNKRITGVTSTTVIPVLDMTVCCRSNDIVWGAYGANAVHFSILQEYMAARIGVGIGTYTQFSNNYHIYENVLEKVKGVIAEQDKDPYTDGFELQPIVTYPDLFDNDLKRFFDWTENEDLLFEFANEWFAETAQYLYFAHKFWKKGEKDYALYVITNSDQMAKDWRLAALQWMQRRMK